MEVKSDPTPGILRVGPYRILRHIARGGMANVFAAEDVDGNVVALKVLFAQVSEPAARRRFRDLCGDLVIRIEDFPTEDILDSMKIDSPFGLLGLYSGVDLARKSVMDPGGMPDMVFLYRRPILQYWTEREDSIDAIVAHVLVHEIGHHFGLSDDDMHRIESEAAG